MARRRALWIYLSASHEKVYVNRGVTAAGYTFGSILCTTKRRSNTVDAGVHDAAAADSGR
jgi:hypothetical protein